MAILFRDMKISTVLDVLDRQIQEAERELERCQIRLETLRDSRKLIVGTNGHHRQSHEANRSLPRGTDAMLGPGEAVRLLLASKPGIDLVGIVDQLRDSVRTKSANKERLLRNTVANMVRDGKIERDERGGLMLQKT